MVKDAKKHPIKKEIHKFADYGTFAGFVDTLPENGPHAYFLFTGTHRENDRSWCISCQLAEPVIKAYLEEIKKSFVFGYVEVGDPVTWRVPDCPFRTDNRLRLMMIPTLVKWKGVQRLEGSQCNKRELLQMMFEDEEETEHAT